MCDTAITKSLNPNPKPKPPTPKPTPPKPPVINPIEQEAPKVPAIGMVAVRFDKNECWDYLMGKCKYGSECKFKHTKGMEGSGKGKAIDRQLQAMSQKPCHQFLAGFCKYGSSCRFSHATGGSEGGSGGSDSQATPGSRTGGVEGSEGGYLS